MASSGLFQKSKAGSRRAAHRENSDVGKSRCSICSHLTSKLLIALTEPAFEFWNNPKMPSTTHYKRGDVVLVPFPFTDLRAAKQRPALVILRSSIPAATPPGGSITSQFRRLSRGEFLIRKTDLAASLPKPSIIKTLKLVTTASPAGGATQLGSFTRTAPWDRYPHVSANSLTDDDFDLDF